MSRHLASVLLLAACGKTPAPPAVTADTPDVASPLVLEVFTAPEPAGAVNSTLIIGDDAVVVVDAQFTSSSATALADRIDALGVPLTHVVISHAHPDHYLGSAVLHERFPQARVVAHAEVARAMADSLDAALPIYEGMLGPEFPGRPPLPEALSRAELEVSAHSVELLAGLQGDTEPVSAVWVSELGTLIASDLAFSAVHAWTADTSPEQRVAWRTSLEQLGSRSGLTRVIPGHQVPGADQSPAVLTATASYLAAFERHRAEQTDAEALITAVQTEFPDLAGGLFLQIGANAQYTASGEASD